MISIVVANILSFMAYLIWIRKIKSTNKNEILLVSAEINILYFIGNMLLGGVVGAMIDVLIIITRYLEYKEYSKRNIVQNIIIVVITIFSIIYVKDYMQYLSIVGFLAIALTNKYNTMVIRIGELGHTLANIMYDLHLKNYVDGIIGIVTVVLLCIVIYRLYRKERISIGGSSDEWTGRNE